MMRPTVMLIGTFDTKGEEYAFVRGKLEAAGVRTLAVDVGVMGGGHPAMPCDIPAGDVAREAGASLEALRAKGDRGVAMRTMSRGAAALARRLYEEGRISAAFGMGGTGGSSVVGAAMRALPFGVPKLLVSTAASGDTRPMLGTRDIALLPAVVDVAGLNSISRVNLATAAGAMLGMLEAFAAAAEEERGRERRPVVAVTMFGNTTPCVDRCRALLEADGFEVLVFHGTGVGGRTMEELVADGRIDAVLDITTTEWADELCGGIFGAGPDRLEAPGRRGIPHVIAPGCVDMVNFGPMDTVPKAYRSRNLYAWNDNVTLMRTSVEENRRLGALFAEKANRADGPVAFLLPTKGVSLLGREGERFWDPDADEALFAALRSGLRKDIPLEEMNTDINDPAFAARAVALLRRLIEEKGRGSHGDRARDDTTET